MDNGQLPPELERLECLLASGARPEPSPALRERVLSGAQCQLRRQYMHRLAWALVATVAATVFVGVVFTYLFLTAFSGGEATTYDQVVGAPPAQTPGKPFVVVGAQGSSIAVSIHTTAVSIPELAQQIRQLSPEISPEEAMRQATLLQIGMMAGGQSSLADQLRKLNVKEPAKHAVAKPR